MEARRIARGLRWLALAGLLGAAACKHADPAAGTNVAGPTDQRPTTDDELARLLTPASTSLSPGRDGGARGSAAADNDVERPVTVTGTAHDAARGAIVLDEAQTPWYVDRLERWPAELRGRRVTVSGMARERKLAPDPVVGPRGERSAGMVGSAHVITQPTWRLAE